MYQLCVLWMYSAFISSVRFKGHVKKYCIKLCQSLFAKSKHAAVSKLALQAPRLKSLPKNKAKFLVPFQWLLNLRLSGMN